MRERSGRFHAEIEKCAAQLAVDRSTPARQYLTGEIYWAEAVGFALVMDVMLGAVVLGPRARDVD